MSSTLYLLLTLIQAVPGAAPPAAGLSSIPIHYRLDRPALTSAGIYDGSGRLVRVLWTMQRQSAGHHETSWDGKDETGAAASAGSYRFRIVLNGSHYRNVGAIGNSGQPPNAFGHTPENMLSVACGPDGSIYTANGWDEAGSDFKKWDPQGRSVYGANYAIRNGKPNGMPYAIATDDRYLYCCVGGWPREPFNERQQIQRFNLSDGKPAPFSGPHAVDGHIQVYEWPGRRIPAGTPSARADLMRLPLRSLAVHGGALYAADALGNRVLIYDAATGDPRGEFGVSFPEAVAFDRTGRIWVGHDDHRITVFQPDGSGGKTVINDLGNIASLCFGPRGELYAADSGAGQVLTYRVSAGSPTCRLVHRSGRPAHPGDRAADAFFRLAGAAVDSQGFLITIQDEPVSGARLARWSPDGRLLWEQFGSEFVSLGNYGVDRPGEFYTMSFHHDRLLVPEQGKWRYAGDAAPAGDTYHSDTHGVPRVLRLGGVDFFYNPTGDGVQVYRISGRGLTLAALVGGSSPGPDDVNRGGLGQWSWAAGQRRRSTSAYHLVDAADVEWFRRPGQGHYSCFGMDVDLDGNIWFSDTSSHSIREIPLSGLDTAGNPVYHWAAAREVIPVDRSPLGFEPAMVQHAPDGSLYALGWSHPWPQKDTPFWMGGSTLVRFDRQGRRLWAIPLPQTCVGLDFIPGGGCMVGEGVGAHILHVSAGGLIIGELQPGDAMKRESGWMDNHACVAVERSPLDHRLDVFAEDDYDDRIGWYRVDDREISTLEQPIQR